MDIATIIVLLAYPIGLILLFFINIYYFTTEKQTLADQIFEFKFSEYTYPSLIKRLNLLQNFLGTDISKVFKRAEYYYINSKKTKRKFRYYRDLIERSIVLIYARKGKETPVTYLYNNLSPLFRFEVMFTMLFFPIVLVLSLFLVDIENVMVRLFVFFMATLICYIYWLEFTRFYLGVKYEILLYVFIIFRLPTGKLRRNINCLTYLFETNYFNKSLYTLLTFAGLAALTGGIKPTSFGGGSFGGGGAGGSW